jgi:hypothetical protein
VCRALQCEQGAAVRPLLPAQQGPHMQLCGWGVEEVAVHCSFWLGWADSAATSIGVVDSEHWAPWLPPRAVCAISPQQLGGFPLVLSVVSMSTSSSSWRPLQGRPRLQGAWGSCAAARPVCCVMQRPLPVRQAGAALGWLLWCGVCGAARRSGGCP